MSFIKNFQQAEQEQSQWIKSLTAISTLVLTALISLMPENEVGEPEKYFLIASWILMTINIPISMFASMLPYALSQYMGYLGMEMSQIHHDKITKGFSKQMSPDTIKSKNKVRLLRCCFYFSIALFCFSFFSLSAYACLRIL